MAIKKNWYEIIAPRMFGERVIGETLSADPKQLIGRTIHVSLMDLGDYDYSKFYIKLKLQIVDVDGRAKTKFMGHSVMHERIYRMVQRRMRRVDAIQDVVTNDNVKLRIKTVFVLTRRVGTSIKDDARRKACEVIEKVAKNHSLEDFIKMILNDELQKTVKEEVKKVYPVGTVEIRKSEVLT